MTISSRIEWQWKIELRASTYPIEEWVTMRSPKGRLCRFVDRQEAEAVYTTLKRIQPHLAMRIVRA